MNIDVLIPSKKTPDLTAAAIHSFDKFKGDINLRYLIYENSSIDFSDTIKKITPKFLFLTNPGGHKGGSWDNAHAIEELKPHVTAPYCFICHSDTAALKRGWLDIFLEKYNNGNRLVGVREDNGRINALHSSGLFLDKELLLSTPCWPQLDSQSSMKLDVTDSYTQYCRDNNLPYYRFKSTFNDWEEILPLLAEPFNVPTHYKNGVARYYDIAVDDSLSPFFAHLGRGSHLPERHIQWYNFLHDCGAL